MKAVSRAHQLTTWTAWGPSRLNLRGSASIGSSSVLQWTVVGAVGIVLGIYAMGVSTLSSQVAPLFVLAVLCPFIAIVAGNAQRLLRAILIFDVPFSADVVVRVIGDTLAFR